MNNQNDQIKDDWMGMQNAFWRIGTYRTLVGTPEGRETPRKG
jgi:hypothetical protein